MSLTGLLKELGESPDYFGGISDADMNSAYDNYEIRKRNPLVGSYQGKFQPDSYTFDKKRMWRGRRPVVPSWGSIPKAPSYMTKEWLDEYENDLYGSRALDDYERGLVSDRHNKWARTNLGIRKAGYDRKRKHDKSVSKAFKDEMMKTQQKKRYASIVDEIGRLGAESRDSFPYYKSWKKSGNGARPYSSFLKSMLTNYDYQRDDLRRSSFYGKWDAEKDVKDFLNKEEAFRLAKSASDRSERRFVRKEDKRYRSNYRDVLSELQLRNMPKDSRGYYRTGV